MTEPALPVLDDIKAAIEAELVRGSAFGSPGEITVRIYHTTEGAVRSWKLTVERERTVGRPAQR